MQAEAATSLGCLRDNHSPSFSYLIVNVVLVVPERLTVPVRHCMGDLGDSVQVNERNIGLVLQGRQVLRSEVHDGVDQRKKRLLDTIVGVVGVGVTIWHGIGQFLLI